MKKKNDESSIEVEHLRKCLKQAKRKYFATKCRLTEECDKFTKSVGNANYRMRASKVFLQQMIAQGTG